MIQANPVVSLEGSVPTKEEVSTFTLRHVVELMSVSSGLLGYRAQGYLKSFCERNQEEHPELNELDSRSTPFSDQSVRTFIGLSRLQKEEEVHLFFQGVYKRAKELVGEDWNIFPYERDSM
jgi:hypothetical protein